MATKARHLKTPIQLWIVDERKRLGLEPADLAKLAGVTEVTARGWESRGKPSEDAIAILERRFGTPAPRDASAAVGYGAGVAAAIEAQTAVIRDLVDELRSARLDGRRLDELEAQVAELVAASPSGSGTAAPAGRAAPRKSARSSR